MGNKNNTAVKLINATSSNYYINCGDKLLELDKLDIDLFNPHISTIVRKYNDSHPLSTLTDCFEVTYEGIRGLPRVNSEREVIYVLPDELFENVFSATGRCDVTSKSFYEYLERSSKLSNHFLNKTVVHFVSVCGLPPEKEGVYYLLNFDMYMIAKEQRNDVTTVLKASKYINNQTGVNLGEVISSLEFKLY